MEYDLSLRFVENALAINSKYHGPRSLKVALRWGNEYSTNPHPYAFTFSGEIICDIFLPSHHLIARVYESKAEFRSALQHEKEGYTIYKNQVPEIASPPLVFPSGWPHLKCALLFSDGRGSRENQGKLRVLEVSHSTGRGSAENNERHL